MTALAFPGKDPDLVPSTYSSMLYLSPVLGELLPSSGLFGYQAHMGYNTYMQAKHDADKMKRIF